MGGGKWSESIWWHTCILVENIYSSLLFLSFLWLLLWKQWGQVKGPEKGPFTHLVGGITYFLAVVHAHTYLCVGDCTLLGIEGSDRGVCLSVCVFVWHHNLIDDVMLRRQVLPITKIFIKALWCTIVLTMVCASIIPTMNPSPESLLFSSKVSKVSPV